MDSERVLRDFDGRSSPILGSTSAHQFMLQRPISHVRSRSAKTPDSLLHRPRFTRSRFLTSGPPDHFSHLLALYIQTPDRTCDVAGHDLGRAFLALNGCSRASVVERGSRIRDRRRPVPAQEFVGSQKALPRYATIMLRVPHEKVVRQSSQCCSYHNTSWIFSFESIPLQSHHGDVSGHLTPEGKWCCPRSPSSQPVLMRDVATSHGTQASPATSAASFASRRAARSGSRVCRRRASRPLRLRLSNICCKRAWPATGWTGTMFASV